ncbi:bifunctional polysaccharide deacetylase/glycosyltransferase family 2 protein [Wenjunlia tyrosinilytica]|uniref:Bi-functional transferase/deacetylase n=1 Tax=Wenjunlia tyrosinilytica TaxID=1544741 RepID=A0A918E1L7_9ACTN|nr:bifunctional polysaccharide deacetylase/glycosyltransferase family 2 protein [Wenjunlia tyrosinilytica]GGO96542.1 bi-functional transferase/deacetylase [Wenjunlia tyrosinilytica]
MSGRHALPRDPRGLWLVLLLLLSSMFAAVVLEGWTNHEFDAAKNRRDCTAPVPEAVEEGGPVLRINGDAVKSAAMPARTVALTFDGALDPVWTSRMLDLLREHHAHATFFLFGVQVARNPDLVRRIREEGHEIGSNTYTGADLGTASPSRARLELSLTQAALAGAMGIHTKLLRMPHTTSVDTMCGAEWKAARRAAEDGYLLVASDKWYRKPSQGAVRQFTHTGRAYKEVEKLLSNRNVDRFTTVTAGLGVASAGTPTSTFERWQGTGLVWGITVGHVLARAMNWAVAVAGGLGVLRLILLVLFARAHVRRTTRVRPAASCLREVKDPVTVLVPAYNEEMGIESTIRSLLASTHSDLQIVVIDDGSTDRTAELARGIGDPRVMVVRQSNAGKAAALNTGLRHAMHDIVVMVDADTVFEPEAVHRLIQPLASPDVGAVSGNTKVGNRRRFLGRWQHLEYVFQFNLDRRMLELLECMPTVPGAIGAFRREPLTGLGGVSEDTFAEDTDLTMAFWRRGWRVVYEGSAVAWTEVPTSLRQLWRQRYRWCYGTLQAMWKHRRAFFETGPAGRFGRRGLSYLAVFRVVLPLLAPVIDVFALYGMLFRDPVEAGCVWLGFLAIELLCAGFALRLDGERLRALWVMPLQVIVYRQLLYLVIIQSVVAVLVGTRLRWHRAQRFGSAAHGLVQEVASAELSSR